LAQKDKHIPPIESRDENEQQNLVSIKLDESKDNIVDDWLIEHFKKKLLQLLVPLIGLYHYIVG
jgi:hypothetical protein